MISFWVFTIIINHTVSLNPTHSPILLRVQSTRTIWWCWNWMAPTRCIGCATTSFEICILCNKWLVSVISFVFSIFCCPWWSIPYWTIKPHWSNRKCCVTLPRVPPYWHIIHKKSDTLFNVSIKQLDSINNHFYDSYNSYSFLNVTSISI